MRSVGIQVAGPVDVLLLSLGQAILIEILGAVVIDGDGEDLGHAEPGNVRGADEHGIGILVLEIIGQVGTELVAHQSEGGVVLAPGPRDQSEFVLIPDVWVLHPEGDDLTRRNILIEIGFGE